MRIGIDLGGTKTEIIVLDDKGVEIYRKRVPTDRTTYDQVIRTMADLVREAESSTGQTGTIGVGIPGTVSARTGLVKNANSTILNGHAIDCDLSAALGSRAVRCANDANCLAVSEAVDGAGAGKRVVFAVILGTGCGSGIAIDGKAWNGVNLVAGEFGHNPLPWMTKLEFPGPACWCGKNGCIETFISGTGFENDYHGDLSGPQIIGLARTDDMAAQETLNRYIDRLARALSHAINLLDPDIIVLGGGMSNVDELYAALPGILPRYVFGSEADTPVVRNKHGDSSGVRGAAWLW